MNYNLDLDLGTDAGLLKGLDLDLGNNPYINLMKDNMLGI